MICDMPRPRPPYLHLEVNRHGTVVWYVRIDHGPRIRIKARHGTPEFDRAYRDAIAGKGRPDSPSKAKGGTLKWLVDRYKETAAWRDLSPATRRQRENIFRNVLKTGGDKPFADITKDTIQIGLAKRADTPFSARNFLQAMRGIFIWAHKADLVKQDPTATISASRPRTEGFVVWSEADIDRYEARWPTGTRERLAFDILLYTGLRRGDAAKLGRQHVRNGLITLRMEKTGDVVMIPILPVLDRSIAASPTGEITFIAGERGRPMAKESFGNWFKEACVKAGVPGSAHGLRKAGATRAAENGATVAQLEAIFGWRGGGMAALYTRAADRRRLAMQAMDKLERAPQTENVYSLTGEKVRE